MSDELKKLTTSDEEIGSHLGGKLVERNYTQENHYKRLDQELDSFASGLREVQTKIPNIESKLENINTLIENKVIKEIESKKLATKEDLRDQIGEIKSNRKLWIGLIAGAILTLVGREGWDFAKTKYLSHKPEPTEQPVLKSNQKH